MFSIVSNYYHPSLESGSDTCLTLISISKGATYLVPMDLERKKIASVQESSYKDYLLLSVWVFFPPFLFLQNFSLCSYLSVEMKGHHSLSLAEENLMTLLISINIVLPHPLLWITHKKMEQLLKHMFRTNQ